MTLATTDFDKPCTVGKMKLAYVHEVKPPSQTTLACLGKGKNYRTVLHLAHPVYSEDTYFDSGKSWRAETNAIILGTPCILRLIF